MRSIKQCAVNMTFSEF